MLQLRLIICLIFVWNLVSNTLAFSDQMLSDNKPWVIMEEYGGSIYVKFSHIGKAVSKANDQVKFLESLDITKTTGMANIPYKVIIVEALPEDIIVKLQHENPQIVNGLLPSFEMEKKFRCPCTKSKFSRYDRQFHQNNLTPFYKIDYLGDFRNAPISRIVLFPVRYSPQNEQTWIYPDITFEISSTTNNHLLIDSDWFLEKLNKQYLIVSPKEYIPAFKKYMDYKKHQGYQMMIISLEQIGSNYNEIKMNLKKIYDTPSTRFSFAMLVGHENMFPTEYVKTSSNDRTPTDYNYFSLGGDLDSISDVLYSRLTVRNLSEVSNQLEKFMEFESQNFINRNNILAIASNEGSDPSDYDVMNEMMNEYGGAFDVIKRYQDDRETIPQNIKEDLSNGLSWVYYLGHGTGSAWSSLYDENSFSILDIKKISSNISKPILIDISCSNGRYSINTFGERFMNTINRDANLVGAASYLGGSVSISWHAPAIFAQGLSKNSATSLTLGEMILKGKFYLLHNFSDLEEIKDTYKWFQLQGDPSLKIIQ